jgi:hypothetical protein
VPRSYSWIPRTFLPAGEFGRHRRLDAVGGEVLRPVAEYGATLDVLEPLQLVTRACAVEEVVAEHQVEFVRADVLLAEDEGLG